MILIVGPNEVSVRGYVRRTPALGDHKTVSAAHPSASDRIRGIQAQAIVFVSPKLHLSPELGYVLQSCFSNHRDMDEAARIRREIAQETEGGEAAIKRFAQDYYNRRKKAAR